MEILFITHKYPPAIGGMEKHSYELARGFEKAHKVHLLAYRKSFGGRLAFFARLFVRVRRILKKNPSISVVYVNDGLLGIWISFIKKHIDVPIVATLHGLEVSFPTKFYRKFLLPRLNLLDRLFCVSNHTMKIALARGIDPDRLTVIRNGLNNEKAKIDDDVERALRKRLGAETQEKMILLAVGRAVKRKGFSWFATEVLPNLPNNVIFVMVGPILKRNRLVSLMGRLLPPFIIDPINLFLGRSSDSVAIYKLLDNPDFSDRIFHLGRVSHSELCALYSLADIFVMPNIKVKGDSEGFGLVALEAALYAKPVVAAKLEGIPDAVTHLSNGVLVESGNKIAWQDAIMAILNLPDKGRSFGSDARDFTIGHFSWQKMTKEYIREFRQLCKTKKNANIFIPSRPSVETPMAVSK